MTKASSSRSLALTGSPRAPVDRAERAPVSDRHGVPALPGSRVIEGRDGRQSVRVLICDDQPVYLLGLRALLMQVSDITLVGECADPMQAWSERCTSRPDVVVVGHGLSGAVVDVVRRFDADGVAIVVLADPDDEGDTLGALRAGSRRYLPRHVSTHRLLDDIRAVHRQKVALDGAAAQDLLWPWDGERRLPSQCETVLNPMQMLTARQREVAGLVAAGMSNAEVAGQLYVSQATVKSHLTIILKRLGLRDRTQLAIQVNRSVGVDSLHQLKLSPCGHLSDLFDE